MANYYVRNNKKTSQFFVVETSTKQILEKHSDYNEAKKMAKHYNSGGGFDGNTPPFMLRGLK